MMIIMYKNSIFSIYLMLGFMVYNYEIVICDLFMLRDEFDWKVCSLKILFVLIKVFNGWFL